MLFDSLFPGFSSRETVSEWMDEDSIAHEQLHPALRDLRRINGLLGGYRTSSRVIDPLMRARSHLRILDVGTGSGDYLVHLVKRGTRHGCHTEATGIDVNPDTVQVGRRHVEASLSESVRPQVTLDVENALELPYETDAFDVSHAALVLHHFHGPDAVRLLQEMNRVSQNGIVINDLHRHPVAYAGIWLITRGLQLAPMVQHDAPISVRRGFSKSDLRALAQYADLPAPTLQWHWAFRWTLSTVSVPT